MIVRSMWQQRLAVVEVDVGRAAADVRRVDVELQEEEVIVARGDVAELERDAPVAARLADGRRLDRVQRHALEPPFVELESSVLQVAVGGDREPRLPEQLAADVPGRIELEIGGRGLRSGDVRALAEEIGQGEQRDETDEDDQCPPDPRVVSAPLQVAVPLQDDAVGNRRHRGTFSPKAEIEALSGLRAALVEERGKEPASPHPCVPHQDERGRSRDEADEEHGTAPGHAAVAELVDVDERVRIPAGGGAPYEGVRKPSGR